MKYLKYLFIIVIALFFLVACEKAADPVDPYGGEYKRKVVSSEGLQFVVVEETEGEETYRVFDKDGNQIGLDYNAIEFFYGGEVLDASLSEVPPAAPYRAVEYDGHQSKYWLLGADGKEINLEPYEYLSFSYDSNRPVLATQNGNMYYLSVAGDVLGTEEAGVTETFFDGEYQLYQYYRYPEDPPYYGLLDRNGNEIVSPVCSRIAMPFKDRYILYDGSFQSMSSMWAMLYSTDGTLLSDRQNDIGFYETEDGKAFGLAYTGDYYNPEFSDWPLLDLDGNPASYGMWFTDRDGTPITDSFKSAAFFPAGTKVDESVYTVDGWESTEYFMGSVKSVAAKDFFLVLTFDGKVEILTVDKLCALAYNTNPEKGAEANSSAIDYYYDCGDMLDSDFYANNKGMLGSNKVDPNTVVRAYFFLSKYGLLREKGQIELFLKDYKDGREIRDMLDFAGSYYATLSDGSIATMQKSGGKFTVDTVGQFFTYKFPQEAALTDEINAAFGSKTPKAFCVFITRYLEGILLSSGDTEYFIVTSATFDFEDDFKVNKLYKISDIVDYIEKNKNSICG